MITPDDLLRFAVVPLVLSLLIVAITWRRSWGPPLAVGLAFIAATIAVLGFAKVRTLGDATAWLAYAGLAFTAIALLVARLRWRWWLGLILLLVTTAAFSGFMLKFNFTNGTWSPVLGGVILLIISVTAVVIAGSMQIQRQPILTPLAMSMIGGIGGLTVMTLADQSLGEVVAAIGVALLPIFGAAFLQRRRPANPSTETLIFGGLIATGLACGVYASEIPIVDALVIAGASPLFAVTALLPRWKLREWQRGTIRLVITAIPLLIVLVMAVREMQKENAASSEEVSTISFGMHQDAADTSATSRRVL